jgi:ribosomal protein S18 acetylase RimI-like enzyme
VSPLVIRDARVEDLQAVQALLVETWHATYDALLGVERVAALTAAWHAPEVLRRQVDIAGAPFLVASEGKAIVATASAAADAAGEVRLGRLYVRPSDQRRGIGGRVLAAIVARFPSGARMVLEVDPGNAGAIAFYRGYGFAIAGERTLPGAPPSLVMARAGTPAI